MLHLHTEEEDFSGWINSEWSPRDCVTILRRQWSLR